MIIILAIAGMARGNDLRITNSGLGEVSGTSSFAMLTFNIAWDNSWRDDSNYDAVWVFVKYNDGSSWQHATLDLSGHGAPAGATIDPSSDGKGAFIYRSSNGSGNVNFESVQLRWDYGADGLSSVEDLNFRIYAIEMAFVPQGSFYLGDGQTDPSQLYGNFESGTSGSPFLVTSENAITLGGGAGGSLGNNNKQNHFANGAGGNTFDCSSDGCLVGSGDDFDDATSQTLPAAFPKGFNAFYCMKYEMTQQQFTDMLNSLTSTQQTTYLGLTNNFFYQGNLADSRYNITVNNGVYSTADPNAPMIFFDWIKAAAYADWAALRPMTEFEFEKACRGFETPVLNEYAWGNANVDLSDNLVISNEGQDNENITSGFDAGGTNGNAWIRTGNQTMMNVARVGIFAAHNSNSGRVTSGGSVWGIMELSGNAWERAVSAGHPEGRKFTGTHGDGSISPNGYANVANWPGTLTGNTVEANIGVGYRGAGLAYPNPNLEHNARVSSRRIASGYWNTVINDDGARFVRTAN